MESCQSCKWFRQTQGYTLMGSPWGRCQLYTVEQPRVAGWEKCGQWAESKTPVPDAKWARWGPTQKKHFPLSSY